MTVKELIKRLQKVEDQNRVVVLSSDSEGNSYSLLAENGISDQYTYRGDGYEISLSDDDTGKPALVLWP